MTPETQFPLTDMPVPLVFATHRIIRDCNSAFADLFGFHRQELIDRSFSRLYPGLADFVRTGELWSNHMAGGKIYYDERIMATAEGKRFWCKVNGRSRNLSDPFAEAIYCFQPLNRPLADAANRLTGRQRQILTMIAQGKTSADVADELKLSRRTVEAHRARIMRSAGLKNAAELVAWFSTEIE
ncbi:PAS and helix-turn-helix domain-containing protein [Rhizobium sp. RAF56]|jgi:PAS domain S-box-containing protein|uniref:PAS and helix-turn-helix domain-containing protein n=1 Tax=Rhizobium sp. RAF56 TaxID=3233062 RepID=UPI003F9E4D86